MKQHPLKPFGLALSGVDVTDTSHLDRLPALLHEHGFLILPKAAASPTAPDPAAHDSLVALANAFGTVQTVHELNTYVRPGSGVERHETSGPTGRVPHSDIMHSDVSWRAVPNSVSVLAAKQLPADGGGNTMFYNAHDLYNRLSPETQAFLRGNTFDHSYHYGYTLVDMADEAMASGDIVTAHPGVIEHPRSGKPLVYVNMGNVRNVHGLTFDQSVPVLERLFDEIYQREFVYEHQWHEGDVVIWDNFGVQHQARADYRCTRVMHRVIVRDGSERLVPFVEKGGVEATLESRIPQAERKQVVVETKANKAALVIA